MTKFETPQAGELATTSQLNRATLFAAAAAAVILVTTVLPAEYGVDPTGVGATLGLAAMGEMKQVDVAQAEAPAPANTPADTPTAKPGEPAEVRLTLQPDEGREVKATMKAGDEIDYRWATDGPEVRFELHGEPTGAADDVYTSYEKGSSAGASGKLRAPFDGTHGWYWKNRSGKPVNITVTATGAFEKFALKP